MNELANNPGMTQQVNAGALLGELLLQAGSISNDDLAKALSLQDSVGGRLGAILVRIGAISEDNLLPVLSGQLGFPLLSAEDLPLDSQAFEAAIEASAIGVDWWLDQEVLAWEHGEGNLRCLARDFLDNSINEIMERSFPDHSLEWCIVPSHTFDTLLDSLARARPSTAVYGSDAAHLRELAEEAPVIEFVNNLMAQASDQGASDIHIEPEEQSFSVRFRIDGVLYDRFKLPRERFDAIASRIKLISGMDIAERRLPQDGRLESRVSGTDIDIRVSAVPGVHGESIVMRLLPKGKKSFDLAGLGFEEDNLARLQRWVHEPHGIVLVTGPTGSGKSTTLYAALEDVSDGKKKIITVEDPVEYRIAGITQIQTLSDIGYTFANALRAILRQDPDVVMVGEIRDKETAEIAVQASLTGHMVLSTLHTNDALSAFTRLIDMGIEPFLVATPVRGVMAQRLVRRLCDHCAEPATPLPQVVEMAEQSFPEHVLAEQPQWRKATGCSECNGTGYSGRIGIHEMVEVSPEMQELIIKGASQKEMRELANSQGMRSLRIEGLMKAYRGITSIEEIMRVTAE
jgi:general secretion pathway protein E